MPVVVAVAMKLATAQLILLVVMVVEEPEEAVTDLD